MKRLIVDIEKVSEETGLSQGVSSLCLSEVLLSLKNDLIKEEVLLMGLAKSHELFPTLRSLWIIKSNLSNKKGRIQDDLPSMLCSVKNGDVTKSIIKNLKEHE